MKKPRKTAKSVIESWMLSNLKNQGYDRYEDLHIDHIDQAWKARDSWTEGGFEAFRIAVNIRNRHSPSFSVVLAFALTSGKEPRGLDFRNQKEMKVRLSSSPPSLYIFKKGTEPWTEKGIRDSSAVADNIVVENISCDVVGSPDQSKSCYYMEFRQIEFGDYSRSVFVSG